MKRALITGVAGQDGFYLSSYLTSLGYEVWGIDIQKNFSGPVAVYEVVDLADKDALCDVLNRARPDEIYYLAAYHHASESTPDNDYLLFTKSYDIQVFATLNILLWIREFSHKTRMFYASSCYVFGSPKEKIQNEDTLYAPSCVYGMTKLAGMNLCKYFREKYAIFATCGILFNHESPLRSSAFVTQKIAHSVQNIKKGKQKTLVLGDLRAVRDWGYAGDYVRAMHAIVQLDAPGEYVVATGVAHTVNDFVQEAFGYAGLKWNDHVVVDQSLLGNKNQACYVGDSRKLRMATGWSPQMQFKDLVRLMVDQSSL